MTFNIKVLRAFFPKHESQRVEFRHALHFAEACAEDMKRTLQKYSASNPATKVNGAKKDM